MEILTDWAYGAQGSFDFTLEVSEDKRPPVHQLIYLAIIFQRCGILMQEHWISATVYDLKHKNRSERMGASGGWNS